jgi:hypothetical protein
MAFGSRFDMLRNLLFERTGQPSFWCDKIRYFLSSSDGKSIFLALQWIMQRPSTTVVALLVLTMYIPAISAFSPYYSEKILLPKSQHRVDMLNRKSIQSAPALRPAFWLPGTFRPNCAHRPHRGALFCCESGPAAPSQTESPRTDAPPPPPARPPSAGASRTAAAAQARRATATLARGPAAVAELTTDDGIPVSQLTDRSRPDWVRSPCP